MASELSQGLSQLLESVTGTIRRLAEQPVLLDTSDDGTWPDILSKIDVLTEAIKALQARQDLDTRGCEKTSQADELCTQQPEVWAKRQASKSGEELLFDRDVVIVDAAEAAEHGQNLQPMTNKQLPDTVQNDELVLITQAAAQEGTFSAPINIKLLPVEDPDRRAPSPGFCESDLDTLKIHTPSESIPMLAPLQVTPSHDQNSMTIQRTQASATATCFGSRA